MEGRSGGAGIIETILKLHGEQRRFTRIPIQAQAKILIGEHVVEGTVKSISLGGAFVELAYKITIGSSVFITIADYNTSHTILQLPAKVVSVTDTGVGMQFESTIIAQPE